MPTVQIWVNNDNMDTLRRLKAYLENEQDRHFEGKSWRMRSSLGRRKRVRREAINESYIYRQALNLFWAENEERVIDFEKRGK